MSNQSTRFIHASDIHLGSHQYDNNLRSDDYINALDEILRLAIKEQVDFVLIGGDVFTSLEMLPGKLTKIVEILKGFRIETKGEVPIIAIEGNHDIRRFSRGVRFSHRNQSWLKLCASLGLIILLDADFQASLDQMFKPYDFETKQGGKIQIKNVMIYGTRYLGERPISDLSKIRRAIKREKGIFNILLQHFGVEGQIENVPGVELDILNPLRHRVDYLALGHFHKQFILDDWIYNPGSSEAVCLMDCFFKRGIFLVEVNGNEPLSKNVKLVELRNRKCIFKTIKYRAQFNDIESFYTNLKIRLKDCFKSINNFCENATAINLPFLFLRLEGVNPLKRKKIYQKDIQKVLSKVLPIIGVRVYMKFNNHIKTIESYFESS